MGFFDSISSGWHSFESGVSNVFKGASSAVSNGFHTVENDVSIAAPKVWGFLGQAEKKIEDAGSVIYHDGLGLAQNTLGLAKSPFLWLGIGAVLIIVAPQVIQAMKKR